MSHLQESTRVSERPNIELSISPTEGGKALTDFDREGGRYRVWYYVINTGEKTAYRLKYYHGYIVDTAFVGNEHPTEEEFETRFELYLTL